MNASVQKEGFNFSSRHDFGDPSEYFDQFELLTRFYVHIIIDTFQQSVYYLETDDGYVQVASQIEYCDFVIIAQFRRSSEPLKNQLKAILKEYIKVSRFFTGFPIETEVDCFFSKEEFNLLLTELIKEFERNKKEALKNPPALTELFKEYGLEPHPNENGGGKWLANCPKCKKYYIMFGNDNLKWRCACCGFHGEGEQEFRAAMKIIRTPNKE